MGLWMAIRMFEKMLPTTKSTLSRSSSALDLGHGEVGLLLVVDDGLLDVAATHLAAEVLHARDSRPVACLLAENGRWSGQGDDDARS